MLQLYTFSVLHFSEKARWALDFNGLPYREHVLAPGAHMMVTKRLAPQSTVPILVQDGRVVQGSSAILDDIENTLKARRLALNSRQAEHGAALEALADHALGLGIQCIFYGPLLKNRRLVVDLWRQGSPAWSGLFYALTFPLIAHGVKQMYKVEPVAVAQAQDRFRRAMDTMDQQLANQPYLLGDQLTRVDITVASLLAPLYCPPEHPTPWPPKMPPEIDAFKAKFVGRPIEDFVRRMYREHRRPPKAAPAV